MLTACAEGDDSAATPGGNVSNTESPARSEDARQDDNAAAPEQEEEVELVFYSIARDSEEVFNERMGKYITENLPHIKINYVERIAGETDLAQYVLTDQKIDLIWGSQGSWGGGVLAFGLEYDMTDLIDKHDVDLSRIEPSLVEAIRHKSGGKLYGIPYENSTNVIFYNKDIFDLFGVDYPKDGMTWPEFADLAMRTTGVVDGQPYIGHSPSRNHMILMNSFSIPLIDPETEKSTYHDDRWRTILETELFQFARDPVYQEVMDKYRNGNLPDTNTFLRDRVLASMPGGPLVPIVLAENMEGMNWDMAAFPVYEQLPGVGPQSYPNYMSIANMSENKDAAMQVIKYLISDEYQTELSKMGNMTVLQNREIQQMMGQESAHSDKNYGAFFYNQLAPIPESADVPTEQDPLYALTDQLIPVIKGEIDVNTALRRAEEAVNNGIETAKKTQ